MKRFNRNVGGSQALLREVMTRSMLDGSMRVGMMLCNMGPATHGEAGKLILGSDEAEHGDGAEHKARRRKYVVPGRCG